MICAVVVEKGSAEGDGNPRTHNNSEGVRLREALIAQAPDLLQPLRKGQVLQQERVPVDERIGDHRNVHLPNIVLDCGQEARIKEVVGTVVDAEVI